MKIVFIVERLSNYRFFLPLIKASIKRKYLVECWHDYSQPQGGNKGYSFPRLDAAPNYLIVNGVQLVKYFGCADLKIRLEQEKTVDAVISIHAINYLFKKGFSKRVSFCWIIVFVGIDHFIEMYPLKQSRAWYCKNERFCIDTKFWKEEMQKFYNEFAPKTPLLEQQGKIKVTGSVEFDLMDIAPKELIREKYGIPKGKDICLYLPYPYADRGRNSAWERAFCGYFTNVYRGKDGRYTHEKKRAIFSAIIYKLYCLKKIFCDPFALKFFLKKLNEKSFSKAMKKFCHKNNLWYVIKPRLKFPVSAPVQRDADLVIWDDEIQQDPSRLKELLSISRILVSYSSTAIFQAAYMGVFSITIPPPIDVFCVKHDEMWYSVNEGDAFNFPGVNVAWALDSVIQNLTSSSIDEFVINEKKRKDFLSKYLNDNDNVATDAVLDIVANYRPV